MLDKDEVFKSAQKLVCDAEVIDNNISRHMHECLQTMRCVKNMYDAGLKVGFTEDESFLLSFSYFESQLNKD